MHGDRVHCCSSAAARLAPDSGTVSDDDLHSGGPPRVPAGWYADPAGAPLLRYWDGERFTHATAPAGPVTGDSGASGAVAPAADATAPANQSVGGTHGGGAPGWLLPVVGGLIGLGVVQYLTTDHAFRNMPIGVLELSSKIQVTNPCRAAYIRGLHELDQVYSSALAGQESETGDLEDLEDLAEMCELPAPELDRVFE